MEKRAPGTVPTRRQAVAEERERAQRAISERIARGEPVAPPKPVAASPEPHMVELRKRGGGGEHIAYVGPSVSVDDAVAEWAQATYGDRAGASRATGDSPRGSGIFVIYEPAGDAQSAITQVWAGHEARRGGARPGAGRKPGKRLTELVRVRCSPETRALIRELARAGETDSDVIRAALVALAADRLPR